MNKLRQRNEKNHRRKNKKKKTKKSSANTMKIKCVGNRKSVIWNVDIRNNVLRNLSPFSFHCRWRRVTKRECNTLSSATTELRQFRHVMLENIVRKALFHFGRFDSVVHFFFLSLFPLSLLILFVYFSLIQAPSLKSVPQ